MIRALSASETNEQREIEKAKLEKEYKRSDQRLEELVSSHDQDLMEVMQVMGMHISIYQDTYSDTYCCKCMSYRIMHYLRYSVHCLRKSRHHEKKFMR